MKIKGNSVIVIYRWVRFKETLRDLSVEWFRVNYQLIHQFKWLCTKYNTFH